MRNETTRLAVQTKVMRRKPSVLLLLLLLKKVTHKQVCFMDEKSALLRGQKVRTQRKSQKGAKGRQGAAAGGKVSLFSFVKNTRPETRVFFTKKKGEREMKRDRGGEDSSDEQVYIRLSPRARLNNASSSSSSFRFPSLSLSVKIREREREILRRKKKKTRENVEVEEWKGEGVRGRLRFHV